MSHKNDHYSLISKGGGGYKRLLACPCIQQCLGKRPCDQIELFLKGLATNFLTKEDQMLCSPFWALLKTTILMKNCNGYFLGNF